MNLSLLNQNKYVELLMILPRCNMKISEKNQLKSRKITRYIFLEENRLVLSTNKNRVSILHLNLNKKANYKQL
jgi:hypothetical protein